MKHDARDEENGQYTNKGPRLCKCGRVDGVHDAHKPKAFGDYSLDERDLPDCEGFRAVRKPDPEALAAAMAAAPSHYYR